MISKGSGRLIQIIFNSPNSIPGCTQITIEIGRSHNGENAQRHLVDMISLKRKHPALGWAHGKPCALPIRQGDERCRAVLHKPCAERLEGKDKKHVEWVKAWVQTLSDLQAYVKQYHTTGLVWSGEGAAAGLPATPPGCPHPTSPRFSNGRGRRRPGHDRPPSSPNQQGPGHSRRA
ncbi:hypothetical protein JTB14_011756 [Gonioctena quinquepunctata]|nr:hypothetical protein JTB14_011756 [Gonioctena quinquepunctata]